MIDFYLAQYLRDPLRREPRNVGVIVGRDGIWAGKFIGENKQDGDLDLRTIRWTREPKTYRKWIRYWREELAEGGNLIERLAANNGGNFEVILGGQIDREDNHTAAEICANLFPLLIEPKADDDFADTEAPMPEFKRRVTDSFREMDILASTKTHEVPFPIFAEPEIAGSKTSHVPAFYQPGASIHVMEVVNFATQSKVRARDHAGYAVAMFDDILKANTRIVPVAIVNVDPEDMKDERVKYSMAMLKDTAKEIVFWQNVDQRNAFLQTRREAAFATTA